MELTQIKTFLDNPNPQNRMKAIVELRNYEPSVVVPLLKQRMYDKEFVIRSFVAKGLGYKIDNEGFQTLLDLLEYDSDSNVRAEAANSLSKYGESAIPHLLKLFERDSNWLVRQSILASVEGNEYPDGLLKLCRWGIEGDNLEVKLAAIANLGQLSGTPQASEALAILLSLKFSESTPRILFMGDRSRTKMAEALSVGNYFYFFSSRRNWL
jgi:HEAT repeat protein